MKSAVFFPENTADTKIAIPYKIVDGKFQETLIHFLGYPLHDRGKRNVEAGGGLFCTSEDLLKFYQMIAAKGVDRGKRYLSENSVDMMGEAQKVIIKESGFGPGWNANDMYVGHGSAYGTDIKIYRKNGLIVMYFVMGDFPRQEEIFNEFEKNIRKIYQLE